MKHQVVRIPIRLEVTKPVQPGDRGVCIFCIGVAAHGEEGCAPARLSTQPDPVAGPFVPYVNRWGR